MDIGGLAGWLDLFVEVMIFSNWLSGRAAMAGKKLEAFREWFTPRRKLWTAIGLFAIVFVVPIVFPGTSVTWLVGPASVFLVGCFIPDTNRKR